MSQTIDDVAARLRAAYTSGAVAPLRDAVQPTDGPVAYAVQHVNTHFWQKAGRRIVGRKVGLTAKAVQAQLGVDQPDFGVLFEDMRIADRGVLDFGAVIQARAEAEVAFVMSKDLNDLDTTAETVAAAIAYAAPAIEIVDSRIANWKITFADTVADNGSSAFFVLGEAKRPLQGLDLYTCGMVLEINGSVVSVGAGAACLGHPLNATAWLARTLTAAGEGLKAGDVVLSGALGPMVSLKAGDVVRAAIGGLGDCGFTVSGALS
jgi:2-keto-4-pentenoate hydratase